MNGECWMNGHFSGIQAINSAQIDLAPLNLTRTELR